VGDGQGPAARHLDPPAFNFTYLRNVDGPIGGLLYHQVMNGVTGTAMPPFKTELESEKIWDVSNYVAEYFASGAEAERGPRGIPASFEPPRPDELAPKDKSPVTRNQ
jgi:mono/diheme cytochrome c family protein